MARDALFSTKQPGGQINIVDVVEHPGNIWFVDSGAAGAITWTLFYIPLEDSAAVVAA